MLALNISIKNIRIPHLPHSLLSNSEFDQSYHIDTLFGVDIFWKLIKIHQHYIVEYQYLINTEIIHIIFENKQSNCNLSLISLSKHVCPFWEQNIC